MKEAYIKLYRVLEGGWSFKYPWNNDPLPWNCVDVAHQVLYGFLFNILFLIEMSAFNIPL